MSCVAEIFVCPSCHSSFDLREEDSVTCSDGHSYPIVEGVADLATNGVRESADWKLWNDHLEAFGRRRAKRVDDPNQLAARISDKSRPQITFGKFVRLAGDTVLDIGCGPGRFREKLPDGTAYIGIDPLPILPDVTEFDFARAVSEQIPLADSAVSDVVVLSALDHFKDLDRSFAEMARVLQPGGRVHVMQAVHVKQDVPREIAHRFKDWIEDRRDGRKGDSTPHHMTEFTPASLADALGKHFEPFHTKNLPGPRLAPRKLMMSAQKP